MAQISRDKAERILEERFKGRYVKFSYPGYNDVYGRCDEIAIGTGIKDKDMILIHINTSLYRCSPESLKDCLTLIKPEDGNSHTTR